jgi:hypothetical protein
MDKVFGIFLSTHFSAQYIFVRNMPIAASPR